MDTRPNEHARTADAILDRMREVLGVANDSELARVLGTTRMNVHKWRRRDTRPYPICLQMADDHGVSLDWLLTGAGEMRRAPAGQVREPGAPRYGSAPDGAEKRIEALVGLLSQLAGPERDAVLTDCFARAAAAQQLADLRQAVSELAADRSRKAS